MLIAGVARALACAWAFAPAPSGDSVAAAAPSVPVDAAKPTVVLVRARIDAGGAAWRSAELRIAAELRAAGYEVVDVVDGAWPGPDANDLKPHASVHAAAAAVRVRRVGQSGRVELWVADRQDRPAFRRAADLVAPTRGEAAEEAALYTVEVLHAGVLELPVAGPAAPTDARASGDVAPAPGENTEGERIGASSGLQAWRLRAAALAGGTPGGAGPLVGLALGATGDLAPRLGIDVSLSGGMAVSPVRDDRGSTRWRHARLAVGVLARPWPHARLSPALGLAAAAWFVSLRGEAVDPLEGGVATGFAAIPTAFARLYVALTGGWRLYMGASLGWSLPRVVVTFDRREVARAGRPLAIAALGLEYRLR
ncbi:MAG: hypothetical protein B7733_25645 [Myxococcales bacterium FL481]|nr:MAG: hypothetical protein B7733_25645 [Myxococcales bacterium FL481]